MPDMLVKLYELPEPYEAERALAARGVYIKRALAPDRSEIVRFAYTRIEETQFADEVSVALAQTPARCYIAEREGRLIGFSCFETTAPDFFGPIAVEPPERGRGVGRALLLRALATMREMGYGYAIIGWAGEDVAAFYERCVGATRIPGSEPGIYARLVRRGG